jgi:peptidoglycan glycosyltransferase
VLLFAVLALRQLWIAVVDAPALDADAHNPRRTNVAQGRGSILATDGTPLAFSRGDRRIHPQGEILAQSIGYASARYGTSGLEDAYDRVLTPRPANADLLTELRALAGGGSRTPRGADIITTIDLPIERELYADLARYPRAAGVVMDPRTGAVLALASVPSFDPDALDRDFGALAVDPRSPLLDRSIQGLYPPGSSFKIVTAADALDAGIATPQTLYRDPGGLTVGNFTFHDDENEAIGTQTLTGAFALSSNVDFGQVALQIGAARWLADAGRWGLGQSLDFDLPAARDRIPDLAQITPGVLAQLGFGQASLLVTPLRMALVGATIADGGTTPRPFLVRRIAASDTGIATRPEQLAQPIAARTAAEIRDMMIAAVQRGTGRGAALPGVTVAGKTGTATTREGARSHAWFVAFAPARAPRYVVAIVIENVGYGGTYAAPVARRVLRVALAQSRTSF